MAKPRVLILGGGAGGAVAANRLMKWGKGQIEVTLIDKSEYHEFRPSYLWVMVGKREPDEIRRPLKLLENKGVKYVKDTVLEIDPANRTVKGEAGSYEYDYLIVSLGAMVKPFKGENVCAPWEMDGALECRKTLAQLKKREKARIVVGPASWPYRCPPAPFEVAFLLKYVLEQRGVEADVTVFHEWNRPMQPFGGFMPDAFSAMMEQFGISYIGEAKFQGFASGKRAVETSKGELEYDMAVVIPPHEPAKPVKESDLADPANGYMKVKPKSLQSVKYDDVYGIGDVVAPNLGLGMAGVFAHFQAEHVVSRIIDDALGVYMGEHYNMSGVCVMDLGYLGAAVYCDFTRRVLYGEEPDCRMLGGARAFRVFKEAFEKQWFASLFGE